MAERAFPVVFAREVQRSAAFYEALDFERHFWPQEQYGRSITAGVRFEMFIYVESVDAVITRLRDTETTILRPPQDMPWGERVAYVTDPDGDPVALAASANGAGGS
jgi:lactoylglutathione lyase